MYVCFGCCFSLSACFLSEIRRHRLNKNEGDIEERQVVAFDYYSRYQCKNEKQQKMN